MAIGPESQVLGLSRSQLSRLVRAHTLDDEPADHGSLRNGHLREAVMKRHLLLLPEEVSIRTVICRDADLSPSEGNS